MLSTVNLHVPYTKGGASRKSSLMYDGGDDDNDEGASAAENRSKNMPIVTEILDPRTQQTITDNPEMRAVSDFLQSNDMVSKILAMVCEDRSVKYILDEMLAPRGASLAVFPSSKYVNLDLNESLSFYQVATRAQKEFGEILIGTLVPDNTNPTGFKPPEVNSKTKTDEISWGGVQCCVLQVGRCKLDPGLKAPPCFKV